MGYIGCVEHGNKIVFNATSGMTVRRGFILFDVEQEDDDYDDVSVLPPGKKAALAEYTVATALNNRHLLDLHWSVAPPAKPHRSRREKGEQRDGGRGSRERSPT